MRIITPNRLMLIPVLSTALIIGVACKPEGASQSKSNIYTYELSGTYSPARKAKIGARYEYGTRASKLSSTSGTVKTKVTTAGPKKVLINVLAPQESNGKTVKCTIVVKRNGDKVATITNSGRNSTSCTFRP